MNEHEMRMPFGKHKGTLIKELPGDYLKWLSTIELHGPLRPAVQAALSWKVAPAAARIGSTTPEQGKSNVGAATPSPAVSKGFLSGPQHREAVRPKRAWIPRPETEDLSAYYTPQGADDIPW